MIVFPNKPFKTVYSLYQHEYLGYLVESYVVQLDNDGQFSLQYQNVSHKNIHEFAHAIDPLDIELVRLIDLANQENILKKFNTKRLPPLDFFRKVFYNEKGDTALRDAISGFIEKYRSRIFELLKHRNFYITSHDGNPVWRAIEYKQDPALIHFHFERNDTETIYYPIVKCGGEKVNFQFMEATLLCEEPAYMLLGQTLYAFEKNVDGKKIRPFLDKANIVIPRKIEETYYTKFLAPLISQFRVYAKGFTIQTAEYPCTPVLQIHEASGKVAAAGLFEADDEDTSTTEAETPVIFDLSFQYGANTYRYDSLAAKAYVTAEKTADSWIFHKVIRNLEQERRVVRMLTDMGLPMQTGRTKRDKSAAFSWISQYYEVLQEAGIVLKQRQTDSKNYFIGYATFDITIEETNDWFDVKAHVQFGPFKIPFVQLRNYILQKKREFRLPNGQIAVIPEEWFTRYSELLSFTTSIDNEQLALPKQQLALVQELSDEGLAQVIMSHKLERLRDFTKIEPHALPEGFRGELRPYQKAGYDWLHFLHSYRFGGCLADDMGLGKTVMTLAFIQSLKEEAETPLPTLLVLPTSLIYNWQKEAERFTPSLKIYIHSGTQRAKSTDIFRGYDLIIMSYGILRLDIDFLKLFRFRYAILDESQAIKNPSSGIAQAVRQLNTANRLILTGTPLENSTLDLWSQFSFINPGLLGSSHFFKEAYQIPIEKQRDEAAQKRLYAIIKPFMLRRHKSQVATELPEKIETIQFCDMSPEQEKMYEETKSYYRNLILDQLEEKGLGKMQFMVLQGLMKLRQLANHPLLVDENFEASSGKAEDVMHKLESVIEEGSKVLIFSQFVSHLKIFKARLEAKGITFAYLDGATTNREAEVERFQNDPSVQVFLLSLKAGGVGLNLTAAEYVFMLDPWWNPAIEAQAIDRAHRIGQKNTVFSYKFITRNTVEEKILALQQQKRKLFDDLITTEETFMKSLSREDVVALLS